VKELLDLLRQARREKQISLREISEQTKIQVHYLESLEAGDFDKFPGEVYLKGALRNYAETVGLDPKEVLSLYRSLKNEAPPEEPEAAPPKEAAAPPARKERRPSFIYGLIVLVLLLVAGGYWFVEQYWPKPVLDPSANHEDPSGPAEPLEPAEPGEPGEEAPGETKPPEPPVELIVSTTESTAGETVFSVRNVEQLEMELSCHERCWIAIQADGKEEFPPRNLQQDEKVTATAVDRIWIRLGHPGGVELKINGEAVAEVSRQKTAHNFLFIRE